MLLPYRKQSIDLLSKSVDCFLCDDNFGVWWVKQGLQLPKITKISLEKIKSILSKVIELAVTIENSPRWTLLGFLEKHPFQTIYAALFPTNTYTVTSAKVFATEYA